MIAKKYNYDTHKYEPFELKDGLSYRTQKDKINCANCGKEVLYSEAESSLVLYNEEGLRFMVCPSCSDAEWKERVQSANKQNNYLCTP